MFFCLFIFSLIVVTNSLHFNGGTIRWIPLNPNDNSSSITISFIQTYYWTFPDVACLNNVPISTSRYNAENKNVSCVADCSYDGGYSLRPVNILTDCISSSSAVGVMKSERAVNVTLSENAHFYASYNGAAWRNLNSPAQNNLGWSILTYINLRRRPDGSINTPPIAHVVSPQFAVVNRTTQIEIPVSDSNPGDVVRCRWSRYINGYRRRRTMDQVESDQNVAVEMKKRLSRSSLNCVSSCLKDCPCNETSCLGTMCQGQICTITPSCSIEETSMPIISSTQMNLDDNTMTDSMTNDYSDMDIQTEDSTTDTTTSTSTTIRTTYSFPNRQPVDECGSICYPRTVPTNTVLSNCTLSFRGLIPNTWYAVAIQVEDFIDATNSTPMSSVPVQFLIYVMPEPSCTERPVILPVQDCFESLIGIQKRFDIVVYNPCNSNDTIIEDIMVSKGVAGLQAGNMINSSSNYSIAYKTFTWIPMTAQMGKQEICFVAYTNNQLQSNEYCMTYHVKDSSINCTITTTTTTSTATTSTSTSSASTTSSTSTTSVTISTVTSTSTTSITTTTQTDPSTSTENREKGPSWGLIAGLTSLVLPLGLCAACCLYRLLWSPSTRRRQRDEHDEEQDPEIENEEMKNLKTYTSIRSESANTTHHSIEIPHKSYQVYNLESEEWQVDSQISMNSSLSSYSILEQEYLRELLAKKRLLSRGKK